MLKGYNDVNDDNNNDNKKNNDIDIMGKGYYLIVVDTVLHCISYTVIAPVSTVFIKIH